VYANTEIDQIVLNTLMTADISSLPLDIDLWYKKQGWQYYTYAEAKKLGVSMDLSRHSLSVKTENGLIVYYNDTVRPTKRIRWLLTKEGARFILGENSTQTDIIYFTERFLMPIAPLAFLGAKSADDIIKICNVTREAAHNCLNTIKHHRARIERSGYSALDMGYLHQFKLIE